MLAACRGLSRAGYRASAAASRTPALAHWSRCCEERLALPDPRQDGAAFAGRLEGLLRQHDHAVLLPGIEASLLAVSAHRAALEPLATLGLPPHGVVERCLDKVALLEAAGRAGIAAPESLCVETAEVRRAAESLGFPVVVKPPRSFTPAGRALRQQNAAVAADVSDLAELLPRFQAPLIVQRFEPSRPVISVSGVRAGDRIRAVAVARYRRTWPPEAGPSCFSETIEPPPGLVERVDALVGELGWEGIFQLQLLDLGRGRFAALDLNPRLFGSLSLAVRAGANLPAIWCDWLLGRDERPVVTARAGVRYRWEEGEVRHLAWQLRRGRLSAAADILYPRRHVVRAYFELRDPGPLLARAVQIVRRRRA